MAERIIKDNDTIMESIRELVSEGKTVEISVKGCSMNPFIVEGRDQVILGPWSDCQIRKGAVVLVRDSRSIWLMHRIIARVENTIVLQGDGNVGTKERASTDEIIALMHAVRRKGKIYSHKSICWKAYSFFWKLLNPVRGYALAIWRRLL